jgi:transcription initiation factor TFIID subunit 1
MSANQDISAFLFGNVTEDGSLENEEWDEEMRATLMSSGLLSQISASVGLRVSASATDLRATASISATIHSSKAIDFGDIDEIADDDDETRNDVAMTEAAHMPTRTMPAAAPLQPLRLPTEKTTATSVDPMEELRKIFPSFDRNRLIKFSELVSMDGLRSLASFRRAEKPNAAAKASNESLVDAEGAGKEQTVALTESAPALDERLLFESAFQGVSKQQAAKQNETLLLTSPYSTGGSDVRRDPSSQQDAIVSSTNAGGKALVEEAIGASVRILSNADVHPINIEDWEDKIVWDEGDAMDIDTNESLLSPTLIGTSTKLPVRNDVLERGDWVNEIAWDDDEIDKLRSKTVEINLNDPYLLVEILAANANGAKQRSPHVPIMFDMRRGQHASYTRKLAESDPKSVANFYAQLAALDRYNLSNDIYYDIHRKKDRVRQTFGRNFVQHSLPALRLSSTFYSTFKSKSELRSIHRPALKVAPNDIMKFTRMKNLKKKKVKGQDIIEVLSSVKDITLKDNSNYVLFEYSEEYPLLLSNYGMGSMVVNYYRRKDEKVCGLPSRSCSLARTHLCQS